MPISSRSDIQPGDDYSDVAEFRTVAFDKLDVTVRGGDVTLQLLVNQATWDPPEGITVRGGLFKSWPGLSDVYPPVGPIGVRFKRGTAGAPTTVAFDAFG